LTWEIERSESVNERVERDGYSSLSWPERLYHGVWWLLFVAYGPGFEQYFVDAPQEWIDAAREGLAEIGAQGMLAAFDEALRLLPWKEPTADAARRYELFSRLSQEALDQIYEFSSRFTDQPYPAEALELFAERFDHLFTGPRTELALWKSKIARGVDTTPRYVSKVMDFSKEAEKDRPYSSRSCPHCGYPSPDYRPRCKRCDFPHGRAQPRTTA
jgi:hypothetical protein